MMEEELDAAVDVIAGGRGRFGVPESADQAKKQDLGETRGNTWTT